MIKLKNVSKFYYSKGVVASGFAKINLELNMGEFVVITGESGSGKSTLLNVISGLDTYEEGEMYINGEETSHYTENDFEEYRKQYIGNIFQNFNLVNSYTVYQNIELVMLINGEHKDTVKEKINDIIKQVDLYKYRNTKVSKLSGGQKQRVAIARALAKNAPIIVADEPTGNLDSRSAKSIMRLLSEISKDKLVIIVTHNYEQVEPYATRRIKMHDGKVLEDRKLKDTPKPKKIELLEYGDITPINRLLIGIRNTFNIIPKFILLLIVYLFITIALLSEYTSLKQNEYQDSLIGYNNFFVNTSDKRIVLKKKDKSIFLEEDYNQIQMLDNIDYLVKDDVLLDLSISINHEDLYFYGNISDINNFEHEVDEGRLPKNDHEIVVEGTEYDYYLNERLNDVLEQEFIIEDPNSSSNMLDYKLKIVGIRYLKDEISYNNNTKIYADEKVLRDIRKVTNKNYSTTKLSLGQTNFLLERYSNYNIIINKNVPEGKIIIPEEISYSCTNNSCKNKKVTINTKSIYYDNKIRLVIQDMYNKDNYKKLLGLNNYDNSNINFFVNEKDYNKLYDNANYQSSVFIKDVQNANETIDKLEKMNLDVLYIKDTLVNPMADSFKILQIFKVVLLTIVTIALFFISYFIITIILKSRNIYFSTIRILGAPKKVCKRLLDIELFTISNVAYFIVLAIVILVANDIVKFDYIKNMLMYSRWSDFVILYFILVIMSQLISNKFARKLFKKSAMNTYREEV